MDVDGNSPTQLTQVGRNFYPQPSHDSQTVLYHSYVGDTDATVWQVPITGGNVTQLSENCCSMRPLVSPDGSVIAVGFSDLKKPFKIGLIEAGEREPTRFVDIGFPSFWRGVKWLPDGQGFAYIQDGDIWLLGLDGSPSKRFTRFGDIHSFAFSTDGDLAISRGSYISDVNAIANFN
jgi:hypothetical protein